MNPWSIAMRLVAGRSCDGRDRLRSLHHQHRSRGAAISIRRLAGHQRIPASRARSRAYRAHSGFRDLDLVRRQLRLVAARSMVRQLTLAPRRPGMARPPLSPKAGVFHAFWPTSSFADVVIASVLLRLESRAERVDGNNRPLSASRHRHSACRVSPDHSWRGVSS